MSRKIGHSTQVDGIQCIGHRTQVGSVHIAKKIGHPLWTFPLPFSPPPSHYHQILFCNNGHDVLGVRRPGRQQGQARKSRRARRTVPPRLVRGAVLCPTKRAAAEAGPKKTDLRISSSSSLKRSSKNESPHIYLGNNQMCSKIPQLSLKFIYSEKATKFCEISTVDLTDFTQDKSKVVILQSLCVLLTKPQLQYCLTFQMQLQEDF